MKFFQTRLEKVNFRGYTNPHQLLLRTQGVLERAANQMPWNDADVVAQLCHGDNEALARLYDEYSGLVYGIALRVLRNRAAAEDVVQEVFLQLWRNPTSFDAQRGRLAPWLAVIARHKAVDALRKVKFEVDSEEENTVPGAVPSQTLLHRIADAEKAKTLMARLPLDKGRPSKWPSSTD